MHSERTPKRGPSAARAPLTIACALACLAWCTQVTWVGANSSSLPLDEALAVLRGDKIALEEDKRLAASAARRRIVEGIVELRRLRDEIPGTPQGQEAAAALAHIAKELQR